MLFVRGLIAGLLAAVTFQQAALVLLSYGRLIPPPSFSLKPEAGQFLSDLADAVAEHGESRGIQASYGGVV